MSQTVWVGFGKLEKTFPVTAPDGELPLAWRAGNHALPRTDLSQPVVGIFWFLFLDDKLAWSWKKSVISIVRAGHSRQLSRHHDHVLFLYVSLGISMLIPWD